MDRGDSLLRPAQGIFVADDHHKGRPYVLHLLQQDLDDLLAVVTLIVGAVQVVGLVDDQHSTRRAVDGFLRLWCGMTNELTDQAFAGR